MSDPCADAFGASEAGGHPLFPRPDHLTGPDTRRFDLIIIRRWVNGVMETCPRAWKASELRTWGQIIDMYGGQCTYELAAQCAKTHQYQAYSGKVSVGGPPPKPLLIPPEEVIDFLQMQFDMLEPLFPHLEHRSDVWIHVLRTRDSGAWEVCPEVWCASKLRYWGQIVMTYGGGSTYRLLAEDDATGKIEVCQKWFAESACERRSFRPRKRRGAESKSQSQQETATPGGPPPMPAWPFSSTQPNSASPDNRTQQEEQSRRVTS